MVYVSVYGIKFPIMGLGAINAIIGETGFCNNTCPDTRQMQRKPVSLGKSYGLIKMFIVALSLFGCGTARAATCDAGYWLNDTGTCVLCDTGIINGLAMPYYCPGDDKKYDCPTVAGEYSEYENGYWVWFEDHISRSVRGCRAYFTVPIKNGVARFSCSYNSNGYTSIGAQTKCQTYTSDSDKQLTTCSPGYWIDFNNFAQYAGSGDTQQFHFSGFQVIVNVACEPVGFGYISTASASVIRICPVGTYTATDTAAAASDCMPCTNAPANAHYTAANTTDGTPNCEWECDDGFGHTSDDRCLPLCRIGETAMNGINIYAEKHTKYAMAVPRGGGVCWISATRGQGGKLVPVN